MTKFKCGDVVHDGHHYGVVVKEVYWAADNGQPYCWWMDWNTERQQPFAWTDHPLQRVEGEQADKVRLAYMKLLTAGKVTPDL